MKEMALTLRGNIVRGFRKCRIFSLNKIEVTKRITRTLSQEQQVEVRKSVSDAVLKHLITSQHQVGPYQSRSASTTKEAI